MCRLLGDMLKGFEMRRHNILITLALLPVLVFLLGAACDSEPSPENRDSDENGEATDANPTCDPKDTFVATHGQLQVEGPYLKNSCGEHVILKGVSSMWLHWENNGFAESKAAMQWMIENWNIKLIRAAMGVEEFGAYLTNPDKAKEQVNTIVQNAIDLGIYVIIDWHSHEAEKDSNAAVAFFKEMATKWGEYPNVIYETWNEPLTQDWSTVIKLYHQTVVSEIRKIDPDNIIIMGTPRWSQEVNVGFEDPVEGTNLMYTLHFYACSHGREMMDLAWNAHFNGVPIFVTEWGATPADGGDAEPIVCEDEADDWFKFVDDMMASWAAWKLDGCDDSSCIIAINSPTDGPFELAGHGPYVIGKLLEE